MPDHQKLVHGKSVLFVLAAGADSVAVISALYVDDAVERNVAQLFAAIERRA